MSRITRARAAFTAPATPLPTPWAILLFAATVVAGCDDGPAVPVADINVLNTTVSFPDADPRVGAGNRIEVVVRNDGDGLLTISNIRLAGDSVFSIVAGSAPFTLFPNDFRPVVVEFSPVGLTTYSAAMDISSDDPDEASVTVGVSGTGARVVYTQRDRAGVPGVNLLFNHADDLPEFDQHAYNLLAPADDTLNVDKVETVLGWFGKTNPAATRAGLLPDALTVDLAAPSSLGTDTGRELADDALDVMLARVMGSGVPNSDGVAANDRSFSSEFPYVAPPHPGPGGG